MTHPWPEEESRDADFGDVFDEAMKPPKTGQDVIDELLVWLAVSRVHDVALSTNVVTAAERLERGLPKEIRLTPGSRPGEPTPEWAAASLARAYATQTLLRAQSSCAREWLKAWLLERHPLRHFAEHWRSCAKCQAAQARGTDVEVD